MTGVKQILVLLLLSSGCVSASESYRPAQQMFLLRSSACKAQWDSEVSLINLRVRSVSDQIRDGLRNGTLSQDEAREYARAALLAKDADSRQAEVRAFDCQNSALVVSKAEAGLVQ